MMMPISISRFLSWPSKSAAFKDNTESKRSLYAIGAQKGDHQSSKRLLPLPRGHGAEAVDQVVDERAHLRRDISLFWINGQDV